MQQIKANTLAKKNTFSVKQNEFIKKSESPRPAALKISTDITRTSSFPDSSETGSRMVN
jgi:hypothetical protein